MEIILSLLLLGLAFFVIYDKFFKQKKEKIVGIEKFKQDLQKFHYLIKKNDYITTPAEGKFLRRLNEYLKDKDFIVYPKVRIGDIVEVKSTSKGFRPYSISARLDRSHVDFVIIKKSTLTIFCVIELDDQTHNSEKSKTRDETKDLLFEFVKIPLLRFHNTNPTDEEFAEKGL